MSGFPEYHRFLTVYCQDCGHNHPVPIYCGDRFCPICGRQRRARIRDRMNFIVENTPEIEGMRWRMVTLSEPNCTDLAEGIRSLQQAFRRLRQTVFWQRLVFGGVAVIEVTGQPGSWHPHFHAIVYSDYLDWYELKPLWQKLSKGNAVHVKGLGAKEAVWYATKYASKCESEPRHEAAANEGLKGTRWMTPFGGCYALSAKYVTPKACCPECGQQNLFSDWQYGHSNVQLWLDYICKPNPPPENELETAREIVERSSSLFHPDTAHLDFTEKNH